MVEIERVRRPFWMHQLIEYLLGIGLILTNVWVFLRWEFARLLSCGPRRVDEARLRLHRFSRLLIRSIEELYGTITAIPTHQPPQSVT